MKIADLLLVDFDAELANTRRTLERIPEDDPQWKPDEKSMPIGSLAMHVAQLPEFCTSIMTVDVMDMSTHVWPELKFQSRAHLLTELQRTSDDARNHVSSASDSYLQADWKLTFKEKVFVEGPRMLLYRTMYLNHVIHHRAQLGVYLRLLKIPVPSLYGPSADEPINFT